MRNSDALLKEALPLPPNERARLALRLIESLDGEPDEAAEKAWAAAVSERISSLEEGTARTVSADEAIAYARERLAKKRR